MTVSIVPRLFEVEGDRTAVDRLGGLPLESLEAPLSGEISLAVKYGFDRVAAALALLALAPLLATVAIAVRLSMGSPVFFSQHPVGRDGQHFVMWSSVRWSTGATCTVSENWSLWLDIKIAFMTVTAVSARKDRPASARAGRPRGRAVISSTQR